MQGWRSGLELGLEVVGYDGVEVAFNDESRSGLGLGLGLGLAWSSLCLTIRGISR